MKRLIAFVKKMFSRNKMITLFPENEKAILAEVGGNYCSDGC